MEATSVRTSMFTWLLFFLWNTLFLAVTSL